VTVYRWVQRFTPLFADAARPLRHATGDRWFVECDQRYFQKRRLPVPLDATDPVLRRLSRDDEARTAYRQALELATTTPERRFLTRRLEQL
jgi:hypothetical protein